MRDEDPHASTRGHERAGKMATSRLSYRQFRWLFLGIIGTLYFLTCLHRMSPAVIARDLALSFNADAVALGVISSTYFYCYSAAQPVVGYLSDTIGPRRVMTIFFGMAALGSLIFALAPNTAVAAFSRALVGAGVGGVFIPGLKLFSAWYRSNEFSALTGMMIAVGGLAGLSATLPLTLVAVRIGWRSTFVGIAVLSFVLVALCWIIIRDRPEEKGWQAIPGGGNAPSGESDGKAEQSLGRRLGLVFSNADFWKISLATFFTSGVSLTFQGLWGVPYLMDVFDFDRLRAGRYIMLFPLGFAMGGPVVGSIMGRSQLDPRKTLMSMVTCALAGWTVIFFIGDKDVLPIVACLLFLFGFTAGGTLPVSFTLTRDLFPSQVMGTAVGLMNTAPFLGAAVYQPFTGFILSRAPAPMPGSYSQAAYRNLLILFILSNAIALAAASLLKYRAQRG